MSLAALLAERHRREREAQVVLADADRYRAIAAELRAWHYAEQSHFFRPVPDARRATTKTRRAGVTSGGCHEFIARALESPGTRLVYANEVREEAKRLAWRADTKQGLVDLLEQLHSEKKLIIGHDRRDFVTKGTDVKFDEQALTIDFRNGSQIRVFAADDLRGQERGRGAAPHVLWCDEAQKMPHLRNLVDSVFGPSMTDHHGEIWLTGTPSEFPDGYFFEVTQEDVDKRVKGWEVHTLLVSMNPFYGATPEERWARTAGAELERNGWDPDNPPASFRREWLAQWTKTDARYVYTAHRWPNPVFAPLRETSENIPLFLRLLNPEGKDPSGVSGYTDRWYDHIASRRDLPQYLPGTHTPMDWFFGLGIDFGYSPDPFAIVLWAFSPEHPGLHEMWSWKRSLVLPDYQREIVHWFMQNVPGLIYIDGDPGGLQSAHMDGWRELLGFPIEDAQKSAKRTWQEMLNNDGERGRIKMREGSPYLHEMKNLTWVKRGERWGENADRRLADGTVPGNHCADGGLYSYRRYISRNLEEQKPPIVHGTPEWYAEEERRTREAAMQASRDAIAEQRGLAGVDEWTY